MTDNIFDKFTSNAQSVLKEAQRLAEKDESQITTEYLLLAIINIPGTLSHDILREYSVNYDQIKLVQSLSPATPSKDNLSDHSREVLKLSFRLASNFGHFNVDVEHILIALLSSREFGSYKTIQKIGINPEQIRRQLETIFNDLAEMDQMIKNQPMPPRFPPQLDQQAAPEPFETPVFRQEPFAPVREMNPTAVKQKVLEYFATNIVEKAKKKELDPIIGREDEISRAIQILLRKRKNNPVFIGDPGVGKTAIVEGLAQKIADGNIPERLKKRKIYQLDMGLLVAGTMYRGQFEDRLKKVLSEVKEDKSIILFIDEVHSIVGTGSAEGSMDAANILKPALSKGEIRLIGATTFDDYRKFIEKDSALERRLQPIVVSEPTVEETIDILRGIKTVYEDHHQIKVEEAALIGAATLSKKYIHDRFLPDKAIDLLDETLSSKSISASSGSPRSELSEIRDRLDRIITKKESLIGEERFEEAARAKQEELKLKSKELELLKKIKSAPVESVSEDDIAKLVAKITHIPVGDILKGEAQKFLKIESELEKHIAGQKEAISELAKSLRRSRSGLSSLSKPIGSFIFLGPSGVGKTEAARMLAKHIFGREQALIKIDMSEFMEKHNLARLTGAPPGYVGYEDAGKLTESVRKNPYSVILFDEIEKAHPDIFNVLLQILDEGKLTDAKGREVDFKNTIIIMTSNIGIDEYRQITKIGFEATSESKNPLQLKGIISDKLFEFFKPELINRIDKIIVFDPLTKDDLEKIARLKLEEIRNRLLESKLEIKFAPKVAERLASGSFDPMFGARPLIRFISDELENAIAELVLKSKIKKGTIIDYKSGKVTTR